MCIKRCVKQKRQGLGTSNVTGYRDNQCGFNVGYDAAGLEAKIRTIDAKPNKPRHFSQAVETQHCSLANTSSLFSLFPKAFELSLEQPGHADCCSSWNIQRLALSLKTLKARKCLVRGNEAAPDLRWQSGQNQCLPGHMNKKPSSATSFPAFAFAHASPWPSPVPDWRLCGCDRARPAPSS